MAVLKPKPEKIVEMFLGLLERQSLTGGLFTKVSDDTFKGAKGDTVTLRTGALKAKARDYDFRDRTTPIVMDDIEGGDGIAIKLDTHLYSATGLTDEQITLDDIKFAEEVLQPQATAVVDRLEGKMDATLPLLPFKREIDAALSDDPHLIAIEARRLLNADKVAPRAGRFFYIGSDVEAHWLASPRLSEYKNIGQVNVPAVRDAIIGQMAGYPVVVNEELPPSAGYLLHRTAAVLGTVTPANPQGAKVSRTINRNGFAVRWLMDYDPAFLMDRSVVSIFAGITSIQDERDADGDLLPEADRDFNVRGVRLNFTGDASVLPAEEPETP